MRYTRSRRTLWGAVTLVAAALAGGSAAAVAATTALHGRGDLVSQPLGGDLEVVDVHLEPLLMAGASSDLVLQVRNRSTLTVIADRVRLLLPVRDTKPAGCITKVSGPLLDSAGLALVDDQRVVLEPGRAGQLLVPAALSLAAGATGGCGFRVQVDVQAVPSPPRTVPPTTGPSATPPTTRPTTDPTAEPPTTRATSRPPATDPTLIPVTPPPTLPPLDCDAADPLCTTSSPG